MDIFDKMNEQLGSKIGGKTLSKTDSFKDLGIDSLDLVDLIFELENDIGIQFEDDELMKITTVQSLLDLIDAKQ